MTKKNYTYRDFLSGAVSAGLLDEFSEEDLKLAANDPAAGMSLLNYKKDYHSAGSDEARALAHAGAERIRAEYAKSNESLTNTQESLIGSLSGAFDSSEADKLWSDYRKSYLREGQLAYEDSLASSAANTGGIASTAAVAAAQQAKNYYGAQAADKKASLYQQAYENWLAGRAQTVSELETTDSLRQTDAALSQQTYDNAVEKWKNYGYVTEDIADILSLPAGTMYSEQAYNTWYQAYQEAVNGVYTGKTLTDTVNPAPENPQTEYNPAAGDSAANHGKISVGSRGQNVTVMQSYLIALGYHCGDKGADGIFGSDTGAAVRAFQSDHGLKTDGVCGSKTWYALIAALNN